MGTRFVWIHLGLDDLLQLLESGATDWQWRIDMDDLTWEAKVLESILRVEMELPDDIQIKFSWGTESTRMEGPDAATLACVEAALEAALEELDERADEVAAALLNRTGPAPVWTRAENDSSS